MTLENLRNRILPSAAVALLLLLIALLLLSPADTRLGNIVKLAYLHGALNWAGLFAFSAAGVLGLVALLVRRATWYHGTRAAGFAAIIVWMVYIISSILITGLTWGQWVAWNEPRVRATGLILLAALALAVVARLVNHRDFTAAVNVLMGMVPWFVIGQAEAIRHPADPIGGSGSVAIQGFFRLIVLDVVALAAILIAWLWIYLMLGAAPGNRSAEPALD